jgi:hypothetical protein
MASGGITIKGLSEVSGKLKRMEPKAAVRLIRKAFRRALVPVRNRTKELAPKKTGAMADAVKILAGRTSNGLVRQRVVIGKGAYRGDQFYGSMQELGWKQGARKLGDKRQHIEAKRFMREAYNQEGHAAMDHAEQYLWDEIIKVFGATK